MPKIVGMSEPLYFGEKIVGTIINKAVEGLHAEGTKWGEGVFVDISYEVEYTEEFKKTLDFKIKLRRDRLEYGIKKINDKYCLLRRKK